MCLLTFDVVKQIIFEDCRKGIVSRENFEWNKNDFSKEFKSTKNAVEFDPFRAYCQSALNLQIPVQESVKVTDKGIRVAVVCGPLTTLSAQKLKETDPAYSGVQLILVNAPKV